ncbi:hypothetical protein FNW52_20410 [Flavobacterium sp. ZT3R18]|uniref:hypothetical protein n=1 Tax=Flavobacterium sp. ZT3R18 TaxID=2594429 RepID=UPI00117A921F|nr:hypothetical protein [Flavobacterium sp. ZT3R18]TRX30150.1 hypothetical protein FNW52_20410 [Flavobacterium sp. ZT3R18]
MIENISVDEAIKKGHRMVNYPSMLIMFAVLGITIYCGIQNYLPKWTIPVGIILSFILSWLYWSFAITKWRIWSFENVRNVHELKKRAIQEKLIWKDGSLFEKTEIRKESEIEKLNSLQEKFKQTDLIEIFKDDLSIPKETIIYFAKMKNYIEMGIMLIGVFGGIFLFTKSENQYWGIGLIIVCGYLAYLEFREATNTEPQIIINQKGIKTISTKFYNWESIENEEVIMENSGKYSHFYLTYDFPNGTEKIMIDDYGTEHYDLQKLLKTYRGRNNNYR